MLEEHADRGDALNEARQLLEDMKLLHGLEKCTALLRDQKIWARRRAFDKWHMYAVAMMKEAELKTAEMTQLIVRIKLDTDRAKMDQERIRNSHSRTQTSAMLAFFRWRSKADRDLRIAEAERFASARGHLVRELGELYTLMAQSSEVELNAFAAATQRGRVLTDQLANAERSLSVL